jgi:hypothetical protein
MALALNNNGSGGINNEKSMKSEMACGRNEGMA